MKETKLDKTICYLQEAQIKFKDTNSFKIKRIERDIPCKEQYRELEWPYTVSDKIDLKTKKYYYR